MLLDDAAAAYARVHANCEVVLIEDGWWVRLHDGTVIPDKAMTHDDALELLEQERGRAAVVAVLREIISPDVLSRGAHLAGCTLRKFADTKINQGRKPSLALLEGVIAALEEEASRDG